MELRQYAIGVFLDLTKAFDMVDHNILLSKMSIYGVSERSVSWFKSYLSDRTQFVDVSGVTTSVLPITHGVPQGSV